MLLNDTTLFCPYRLENRGIEVKWISQGSEAKDPEIQFKSTAWKIWFLLFLPYCFQKNISGIWKIRGFFPHLGPHNFAPSSTNPSCFFPSLCPWFQLVSKPDWTDIAILGFPNNSSFAGFVWMACFLCAAMVWTQAHCDPQLLHANKPSIKQTPVSGVGLLKSSSSEMSESLLAKVTIHPPSSEKMNTFATGSPSLLPSWPQHSADYSHFKGTHFYSLILLFNETVPKFAHGSALLLLFSFSLPRS